MPLTNEEIFSALGFEGKTFNSIEEFVAEHGTSFKPANAAISGDDVKRITGQAFNSSLVEFKRQLKGFGIETPALDEKAKFEDVIKSGFSQVLDFHKAQLEEAATNSGKPNNELIQAKDAEINKWKAKVQEEKEAREAAIQAAESQKTEFSSTLKNFKLNTKVSDIKAGTMKWGQAVTDVHKKGFEAILSEKYNIDLDESDNVIVTDKQGQQIPNKSKAGAFLTLPEVLESEGRAQKVWQVNPHAERNGGIGQPRKLETTTPAVEGGVQIAQRIKGTTIHS